MHSLHQLGFEFLAYSLFLGHEDMPLTQTAARVTEPRCPRWQHERKVLEIMASADPPLSRREAERNLKSEGKAVPARAPCTGISSVVQPGRTYSAVVSPPAAEPSAPDCEVQKDMVISALAAAVQALIGTIPQSGPVFELCNAALAAHAALNQHG